MQQWARELPCGPPRLQTPARFAITRLGAAAPPCPPPGGREEAAVIGTWRLAFAGQFPCPKVLGARRAPLVSSPSQLASPVQHTAVMSRRATCLFRPCHAVSCPIQPLTSELVLRCLGFARAPPTRNPSRFDSHPSQLARSVFATWKMHLTPVRAPSFHLPEVQVCMLLPCLSYLAGKGFYGRSQHPLLCVSVGTKAFVKHKLWCWSS